MVEEQLLVDPELDKNKLNNIKEDTNKTADLEVEDDFEDYTDKNVV